MTNKNGSKWCRPSTRLAIYLRDNLQCVYCLASLDDGAQLTLDHVKPRDHGGTNAARNLVTACLACNARRKNRHLLDFVWAMHGDASGLANDVHRMLRRVRNATRRVLPRELARTLIALRSAAHPRYQLALQSFEPFVPVDPNGDDPRASYDFHGVG